MTDALRRVVLIVCCVLAVVVAGSFFPAAGYGDYPDAPAVDESHYAGDGVSSVGDSAGDGDGTGGDGSGDEGTDADQSSESETDEKDGTDEENTTETGTETENETATDSESDGGEGFDSSVPGGIGTLLGAVLVGGVAFVGWRATSPERARRRGWYDGEVPTGLLPRLRFRLALIPQATMAGTIAASRRLPSLFDAASRTGRAAGAGVGAVVRDFGRGFATAGVALSAGVGGAVRGLGAILSLSSGFGTLLSGVSRPSWPSRSSRSPGSISTATDGDSTEPEPDRPPETIHEAWAEMIEAVEARRRRHRTPGEYARIAVGRGLPAKPVGTLTALFRDVRYGGASTTADRRRRALEAYARIDRSIDGSIGGSNGGSNGSGGDEGASDGGDGDPNADNEDGGGGGDGRGSDGSGGDGSGDDGSGSPPDGDRR